MPDDSREQRADPTYVVAGVAVRPLSGMEEGALRKREDLSDETRRALATLDNARAVYRRMREKDEEESAEVRASILREALDAVPQDICTHDGCDKESTCPLARVNVALSALLQPAKAAG